MFSKLHDRLGTAGLVVAVVALVASLGGTALAAAGLNSKQKKEVKTIAKQFAGKPGPAGPAGPAGSQGPKGDTGAAGTAGTAGVSPVGTEFPGSKAGHCTEGGVEVKGANTTYVCNGERGANGLNGTDGEPWAPDDVLPEGATETGTWGGFSLAAGAFMYPISFFLPLSEAPTPVQVSPGQAGTEHATECPGFSDGAPTAEPGYLCIYEGEMNGGAVIAALIDPSQSEAQGVSTTGTLAMITCADECATYGTFAVTAPEAP